MASAADQEPEFKDVLRDLLAANDNSARALARGLVLLDDPSLAGNELRDRTESKRRTIVRYLRGDNEPKPTSATKIARVLGLPDDYFAGLLKVSEGRYRQMRRELDLLHAQVAELRARGEEQ